MRGVLAEWIDRNAPKPLSGKASDVAYYPLVPIGDIHLSPTGAFAMTPGGEPRTIRAIAVVGALVLLLATINFVNLKTARAARRAVEVGVRKACGAGRGDLMMQFIGESLIYAMLAMIIGMALVELSLLPWLNAFLDRSIVFDYWHLPVLASIAGTVLVVGTLAGIYPAFVLSSFRPAGVLKGTGPTLSGSGRVRQALVILQFAVLIGLMVSTAIIYRQTQFGLDQGLRFDEDQLLVIDVPNPCEKSSFRTAVENLPGVAGTACSVFFLNDFRHRSISCAGWSRGHAGVQPGGCRHVVAGAEAGGRALLRAGSRSGSGAAAGRRDGYVPRRRERVGRETARFQERRRGSGQDVRAAHGGQREIIGVVPDFSRTTVEEAIQPMFYFNAPHRFQSLDVRLRGAAVPETLRAIDRLWGEIPGQTRPILRQFLDEYVQSLYAGLTRQRTIFAAFACAALLLAGLGLFGLAGFTVERRTREIGIRKAMGAETGDVTRLLLWQFAKPVLWANAVAWPVAGYIMYRWLLGFAYRIDLEPWLFGGASLVALGVAMLTVSTHSILVARAKPIVALRYE